MMRMPFRRRARIRALACFCVAAFALTPAPFASADDTSRSTTCTEQYVPVSLQDGSSPNQFLSTQLCVPDGARTVLLLVSGATYGSVYWDFPYEPERYSTVRAMNNAGIATMNVDRIGIGKSSHPLSLQITIPGQAFAMHQLVTKLRSGVLGTAFDRIIIMGHSMGSAVAETEAAAYDDVDAVIATGLGTRKNGVGLAQLFATFVPAFTQSRFAGKGLDAGYLSTMVGTRGNSFYYKPNADPAVIAEDDATREPVTATELGTIAPVVVPGVAAPVTVPVCAASIPLCVSPLLGIIRGPSADIRVPSLFVLGQKDALICGGSGTDCSSAEAVKAQETPFWGTDCLGVRLVPDAGHDLSLQRNAPDWYATVAAWVHDFEARGGGCPGPIPGVA